MSDENPSSHDEAMLEAITALVPPLLHAMEVLARAGRHLHPPQIPELVAAVEGVDTPLQEALAPFASTNWPEQFVPFKERIEEAATETLKAYEGLRAAAKEDNGTMRAYRALRHSSLAVEALYPVAVMLPPVNRFFLEGEAAHDDALLARIESADLSRGNIGVMQASNDKGSRGGFSLYVPEYYDPDTSYPLIMALHGGSGHGRDFLWTWLKTARSQGAIVVSPTSIGDTWGLMEPEKDTANINAILDHIRTDWNVDGNHMLLTGMSDGGTFSYLCGLHEQSPFTHLAPISSSFHPTLLSFFEPARMKDLPVYITHGALDWMFPADMARQAKEAFSAAGAQVTYSEIADLSHTYPREENEKIFNWMMT